MKRHPGLRELSVEHHHSLVHASRLVKAASGMPETMSQAARLFIAFWDDEVTRHFRDEEEILLPVCAKGGFNVGHELVAKMLIDHIHIRAMVMEVREQLETGHVEGERLAQLGNRLEAHIRLEERSLFPQMQEDLPESVLDEVGALLAGHAAACPVGGAHETA